MNARQVQTIDVSCALIIQNHRVLAVKRSETMDLPGFWEFPGGKVEPNENPPQCLIREIKEELELRINLGLELTPRVFDYPSKRIRLIPFLASIKSGSIRLREHERAVWLGENELFEVNWAPADIPIVRELQQRWNEFLKF